MIIKIILSFIISFFVGIMLNMNVKISLLAALAGCISYTVFILTSNAHAAYFLATFVLSLASGILAKLAKAPSTVFIIIGIYTLVPGSGVYQTIISIINSSYESALSLGASTLINLTLMSMAIAISTSIINCFFGFVKKFKT